LVLIARRLLKQQCPKSIRGALFATAAWALTVTIAEVTVTFLCLLWSWHRLTWLKFVIPICFTVWIVAQLHFEWVIFRLGLKQNHIIAEQRGLRGALEDIDSLGEGEGEIHEPKSIRKVVATEDTSAPIVPS
jgi:hypothetical protein